MLFHKRGPKHQRRNHSCSDFEKNCFDLAQVLMLIAMPGWSSKTNIDIIWTVTVQYFPQYCYCYSLIFYSIMHFFTYSTFIFHDFYPLHPPFLPIHTVLLIIPEGRVVRSTWLETPPSVSDNFTSSHDMWTLTGLVSCFQGNRWSLTLQFLQYSFIIFRVKYWIKAVIHILMHCVEIFQNLANKE